MSFGRPIALLSFLLPLFLCLGCGKEEEKRAAIEIGEGNIRWASFPVSLQVDNALLADPQSQTDLQEALDFWATQAGKPLFVVQGAWDNSQLPYTGPVNDPESLKDNVIFLLSPWPFAADVTGKTVVHSTHGAIERSVIFLPGSAAYCSGNCSGTGSTVSRQKLLAHELGHLVGLGHSTNPNDLMYPDILTPRSLDSLTVDQDSLRRLTE